LPFLWPHTGNGPGPGAPTVIDQDADGPKILLDLCNRFGQGFGTSKIRNNWQERLAVLREHPTSCIKVIAADSASSHYCPFGGQASGYATSEAAARTHDQTNATGNPKIHIQ
jgi:hypothetical protein